MSFNFSYVFEYSSAYCQLSPCYEYNDYNWIVEAVVGNNSFAFNLFGESQHSVVRKGIQWKVVFDLTFTVGMTEIVLENKSLHNFSVDSRISGVLLCELEESTVFQESSNTGGGIPITVRISNIRTVGFRKFKPIDFMSQDYLESDVTISIKQEKIHCHSQSSIVFDSIISNMKSQNFQNYSFGLEEGTPVDEFLELLHHIYFPTEIVDDDNLRMLLHWAKEFEVTPVLAKCEKLMRDSLCNPCSQYDMDVIIEYLLLSWRYNIEPLETSYVYTVLENRGHGVGFNDILSNQHYQEMDSIRRLKLSELVLESLIFREHENSWNTDYHDDEEEFGEDLRYLFFHQNLGSSSESWNTTTHFSETRSWSSQEWDEYEEEEEQLYY